MRNFFLTRNALQKKLDLENEDQYHLVQHSPWYHSMANVQADLLAIRTYPAVEFHLIMLSSIHAFVILSCSLVS